MPRAWTQHHRRYIHCMPRFWYLGRGLMCFRSLAVCVSRVLAQTPFSVVVVPVGSTKKSNGIPGPLKTDPSFMLKRCTGQATSIEGRLMTEVTVGRGKLEMVASFCDLGNFLSSGGGCDLATITRWCATWGKFNALLLVLTPCSFPISSRGRVYNFCVKRTMVHASETDLHRLQRNDRTMIRWMCGVTTKDQVNSQDLLERMQLGDLAKVFCTRRLRSHGHV